MRTPTPPAIAAVAALVLATGCASSYDEDAHRADAARALQVDELDDQTWENVRALADETCDLDEQAFALAAAMSADGDDPERALALDQVNVEHVCPERAEEFDELLSGLDL